MLDEAHLCTPFASTLAAVERNTSQIAPFAVIRMGATMAPVTDLLNRTPGLPPDPDSSRDQMERRRPFRLLTNEVCEKKVSDRLHAPKSIEPTEAAASLGQQLAEWAAGKVDREQGVAVGLVLNTVAEARRCFEHLHSKLRERGLSPADIDLVTITGSMRGWDRDEVVESKEYARFRSRRDRSAHSDRPAFLVATSCIEVGADIDCDHLGTEVCSADSLIQRLGRVNRLGLRKVQGSSVAVVGRTDKDTPSGRVFARLRELADGGPLDGASAELPSRLLEGSDTARVLFDLRVPPPALTPAVLDDLAMTSRHPDAGARPDIGRWLHGSVGDASLYIELTWRAELDWITDVEGAARLLRAFPVSPRETARCPIDEAVEVLAAIRERAAEEPMLADRFVLVSRYGETTPYLVRSLPTEDARLRPLLRDALVVLPAAAGGYDGRFVNPRTPGPVRDVAEEAQSSARARRRRLWVRSGRVSLTADASESPAEGESDLLIDSEATEEDLITECSKAATKLLGAGWQLVECAGNARMGVLVAREDRRAVEEAEEDDGSLGFRGPVLLDQHLADARSKAELICQRLQVSPCVHMAVVEAAGSHDLGKDRPWWQRAVGSFGKPPVAKSWQPHFNHSINRGYRHEIGSVADLQRAGTLSTIDPDIADLCMHLVAAHHGHARPGFPAEAAGPIPTVAVRQAIEAAAPRFARMQATYGWWALAWMEALVKAADVLASREEEETP